MLNIDLNVYSVWRICSTQRLQIQLNTQDIKPEYIGWIYKTDMEVVRLTLGSELTLSGCNYMYEWCKWMRRSEQCKADIFIKEPQEMHVQPFYNNMDSNGITQYAVFRSMWKGHYRPKNRVWAWVHNLNNDTLKLTTSTHSNDSHKIQEQCCQQTSRWFILEYGFCEQWRTTKQNHWLLPNYHAYKTTDLNALTKSVQRMCFCCSKSVFLFWC